MKFKAISLPHESRSVGGPDREKRSKSRLLEKEEYSKILGAVRQEYSRQDENLLLGRIKEAQKEIGLYTNLISRESALNERLKISIQELRTRSQQLQMSQLKQESQSQQTLQKMHKRQEVELQKITQKVNELKAHINSLKQLISHAREERVIYSNIFKSLEKELFQQEEQLRELILSKRDLIQGSDHQSSEPDYAAQERVKSETIKPNEALIHEALETNSKQNPKKQPQQEEIASKKLIQSKQLETHQPVMGQSRQQVLLKAVRELGYADSASLLADIKHIDEDNQALYRRHEQLSQEITALESKLRETEQVIEKGRLGKVPAISTQSNVLKEHYAQQLQSYQALQQRASEQQAKIRQMMRDVQPLLQEVGLSLPQGSDSSLQDFQEIMKQLELRLMALTSDDPPKIALPEQSALRETDKHVGSSALDATLNRLANERQEEGIISQQEMKAQGLSQIEKMGSLRKVKQLKKGRAKL